MPLGGVRMRYIEEVASVQVSSIVRFDSYSCHWEGTSLEILKKRGSTSSLVIPLFSCSKNKRKVRADQKWVNVHSMFTQCSLNVHSTLTQSSLNVHSMFTQRSLNVHSMFTQRSLKECSYNCMLDPCLRSKTSSPLQSQVQRGQGSSSVDQ